MGSIAVGRGPIGDIAALGGGQVVVTNNGDDTVSFLTADGLLLDGTMLCWEPTAVTVADGRAYVRTASPDYDEVAVVDTVARSIIGSYTLAHSISALAIGPDGKRVFAGRTAENYVDVAVIDTTAERVGTIDIGTGAGIGIDALDVDPTGKRLYVATTHVGGGDLVIVDVETARVQRVVPIGAPIRDIALAPGTAYVLTSDRVRGGVVHVIDLSTARVVDAVDLGVGAPTQMVLSVDASRAYIVDFDRVIVLDTASLSAVDSLTVEARPSCVAVDPDGGRLYVADYAGAVTVFPAPSVAYPMDWQLVATDPIEVPGAPELQAAHA